MTNKEEEEEDAITNTLRTFFLFLCPWMCFLRFFSFEKQINLLFKLFFDIKRWFLVLLDLIVNDAKRAIFNEVDYFKMGGETSNTLLTRNDDD